MEAVNVDSQEDFSANDPKTLSSSATLATWRTEASCKQDTIE